MQRDSDEEAWRAIVENYGDRVRLDDDAPAADTGTAPDRADPDAATGADGLQRLFKPIPEPLLDPVTGEDTDLDEDDDGFVPPPPPPLPRLPADRLLAWAGLFGSPSVLLVCVVVGVHLPSWLAYLLVAWFIGGFGYLVATMPRGSDVDPWDDGARL